MNKDVNGREYAKLCDVTDGDIVELDSGFTCVNPGKYIVHRDNGGGALFIECSEGKHLLDGQEGDDGYLIGIYGPIVEKHAV